MSATPGITTAIFEPSLGAKLNNETDRQEEVHTRMTAKEQQRANPETGSAESTQDDQEPLATTPAFVYTRKPTSSSLSILNDEPIGIETKTQRLDAQLTVEAETTTAISSERKKSAYLSNFKMKLSLQVHATDNRPSTSNDVYINNVYTDTVKPLEV